MRIYTNCTETNFDTFSFTSQIWIRGYSQYRLQLLKISAQTLRSGLLCKFPSSSGVCTADIELQNLKNLLESHRVNKLEDFRECPACIRMHTQCVWKWFIFFFILPSCFLWLRHEGNKIFTQDELGWFKMISSIFICTICSVLISFHSLLMLQIYSANKSNEWPEFTFKSQETWTACIYWNNTVIATAFSNKLLTGLTEV